jgi:hypothetical protein
VRWFAPPPAPARPRLIARYRGAGALRDDIRIRALFEIELMAPGPLSRRTLARTAAAVALIAVFALLRAPYVSVPLERDEGEYAYIAQRLLEGDLPYRDAFDQKPPGVFLAYAVAFVSFGQSIESIHGLLYLWTAATALVLFALVRRLAGDAAAVFAALIFSIASADPRLVATAANTEIFMLLPLTASMACLVRGLAVPRPGWWLACGAFAALACWFKQVAALNAAFVAVFAGADLLRRSGRGPALRSLLWMGLGAAVVSAPVLLFFALQGAWRPFLDAVVLHNLAYAQRFPLAEGVGRAGFQLREQAPSLAAFWALAAVALLFPRIASGRIRALLGGWFLASAAGVCVGLYFRPHYFIQVLPGLSALGGLTAGAVMRWLGARPRPAAWVGAGLLTGLVLVPPVVANREILGAGSPDAISRKIYGLNPFPESLEIANYIERTSDADDTVYVIGSEPQILFYAGRRSATRYIFFYPLTGGYPDASERQREVMREVTASRPRYVVLANLSTSLMMTPETDRYVFAESRRWIARKYRLEFVARPRGGDDPGFDFLYGSEAERMAAETSEETRPRAWVAVYRRRK